MNNNITIRTATPDDAKGLLEIYGPYIENTAITFEYTVPTVEEFAERIRKTLEKYPYLVAMDGEQIVGYAYANQFHTRAALSWAVEASIYLDSAYRQNGIGRQLYALLEDILKKQNVTNLYVSIADIDRVDEHLTNASIKFHEKLGFKLNARFTKCGYKFGKWYDLVYMEKFIGVHEGEMPGPAAFDEIRKYFTL